MLSKLIKHEFRATGRVMLPVLGAVLLLSLLSTIAIKILDSSDSPQILNILSGTILGFFVLSLFAVCVVAVVIMVQRFYKNLMRDEGYISMTLPVSVDEHIFAKLIVSFVWFLTVGVVCIIAVMIALSIYAVNLRSGVFSEIMSNLGELIKLVGVGNIIGYALEFVLLIFIGSCAQCLQFYSATAVGCAAAEHKILMSILAYFGMSIALSVIQFNLISVIPNMDISWLENSFGMNMFFESAEQHISVIAKGMHRFFLAAAAYSLVVSTVYYFITRFFLKRKLNLA